MEFDQKRERERGSSKNRDAASSYTLKKVETKNYDKEKDIPS